ncbi:C-X-C chemokine receptor type 3 [Gadus chalcogrammus]|uniref:C-X-C chemokine receptor type 3 n=1 Tax=Gadus chalcogrammus TaxID=1042646 RepID=UPI0024C289C8|nr:C-X-C chemokine receptor type 3 [Gadus chalcogrammus]
MDVDDIIESAVRALMFLLGMLGNNWLAVRSIPPRLAALRTNELLFLNLAVSNLITNYLVDLPDTMADIAGGWFLGDGYCGVFRFCADLSKTSSIFSTLFISVYWYQKLVGSLKRGGGPVQLDSLRLVGGLLAGSWGMAVVFSIPHYFFVAVEGENGSSLECNDVFPSEDAKQTYEALYLTLANALPVAGIVYATARIVVTLMQSQKRIQGHGGNQAGSEEGPAGGEEGGGGGEVRVAKPAPKPSPGSSNQVRAAKSVVAVASIFVVCWVTHLLLRISSNIQTSPIVVEVASYIAASYTCIIPYIFLYGVKKLSCSRCGAKQ